MKLVRGMAVLNRNKDFKRLYAKGKYYVHPALVTYVMKNKAPGNDADGIPLRQKCRAGITASKKTGNAVKRNRSRRIIRQAYLELAPRLTPGWDFVFVARSRTCMMKSTEIYHIMKAHMKSAGVLK